nr:hypothetical protein [Stutzerimonas azotifigens]
MTNALVLMLMVLGWLAMAVAMLWGMLRIARRHHRPLPPQAHGTAAHKPLRARHSGRAVTLNI